MTPALLPTRRLATTRLRLRPTFTRVGASAGGPLGYAEQITVGKAGRCPEQPVLVISMFDNSGSVLGGNDPIGKRFLEVYAAISRVGARCKCGRDLAAVLHFDTPTSGDLKPTQITKPHHETIRHSLAIPPDGRGISCLGPSLTAARQIATQYRHSHRVVLMALTDFELFDDYLEPFIAFPADDVHAVSLRAAPPQLLVDAPAVTVTDIGYASPPGTLARTIFTALTQTRPRAKPLAISNRAAAV